MGDVALQDQPTNIRALGQSSVTHWSCAVLQQDRVRRNCSGFKLRGLFGRRGNFDHSYSLKSDLSRQQIVDFIISSLCKQSFRHLSLDRVALRSRRLLRRLPSAVNYSNGVDSVFAALMMS